jgi:hypothetical protein
MSRDRFLAAGVELFEETGEFPSLKSVQRELEGWRDETDARREARRLPPSLGGLEGEQVVLAVRAVERVEPGSPLLDGFPAGLREALATYRRRDRKEAPTISVADLIRRVGLSEFRARQVLQLLVAEKLVTKVGSGVWEVSPSVRHYRSVRTVEDYLRKKRAFERRRCRRSTLCKPFGTVRATMGKEGAVRAAAIAAAGILLAGAVGWAVTVVVGAPADSAATHRSPHAHIIRPPQGP